MEVPKAVDHDQRRAEIVRAARVVLARDGIDGATMRRIASEAQCTTGRITHYFVDKDDVMIAVLRSVHHSSRQRMEAALREPDAQARLERVIEAALPLDAERRDEWSIWMTFLAHAVHSAALQAELKVRYDDWSALLAGVVEDDPGSEAVRRFVALIDGLGMRVTVDASSRLDIVRMIHDAVDAAGTRRSDVSRPSGAAEPGRR